MTLFVLLAAALIAAALLFVLWPLLRHLSHAETRGDSREKC